MSAGQTSAEQYLETLIEGWSLDTVSQACLNLHGFPLGMLTSLSEIRKVENFLRQTQQQVQPKQEQ